MGKLMANYRRKMTTACSDLVAAIVGIMSSTEDTVAAFLVQAAAYQRAINHFFLRILPVFFTRSFLFLLSRFRECQRGKLRKHQKARCAKTERHRNKM
jgi:hypothetical protein